MWKKEIMKIKELIRDIRIYICYGKWKGGVIKLK